MHFDLYTFIDGESGEQLEVWGTYYPGEKGERDRYGVQIDPDVPSYVCVWRGYDRHGTPVELTEIEHEIAAEALLRKAEDDAEG